MSFKKQIVLFLMTSLALSIHGCDVFSSDTGDTGPVFSKQEINSGGATTVNDAGTNAFSRPASNLSDAALKKHKAGDVEFEASFVTAPAEINGGLGPLFNNSSCSSCHVNDGRGKPFFDDGSISSVLVRISLNGDEPGDPIPVDGFGLQIQNKAIYGTVPEAEVQAIYKFFKEELADGTEIELRDPSYEIVNPYRPLPSNANTSVRTAPPVFGMGLLEAIPKQQILANADPNDADDDGISGKPNYVMNDSANQLELGRFGWKANQPTIIQQVASAYHQDMGISSPYYPYDNDYGNPDADDGLNDDPELPQKKLDQTTFYVQTLGVPAKRNANDPVVKKGRRLFREAGCQSCHIPSFTTTGNAKIAALSSQKIYPYTDLLLHDMGEGLADHRSDYEASGREWRTPPLWGIGLVKVVNGHRSFLHDGRAQSILEAILWHGGEAQPSKEFVKNLSKTDREALVKFVRSL